jgi:hypothetical protein
MQCGCSGCGCGFTHTHKIRLRPGARAGLLHIDGGGLRWKSILAVREVVMDEGGDGLFSLPIESVHSVVVHDLIHDLIVGECWRQAREVFR